MYNYDKTNFILIPNAGHLLLCKTCKKVTQPVQSKKKKKDKAKQNIIF